MNKNKKHIVFSLITLLILVVVAFLCEYSFHITENKLEDKLELKIQTYQDKADEVVSLLDTEGIDTESSFINELLAYKHNIVFFIYTDDALVFWNNNQFDLDEIAVQFTDKWHSVILSNIEGVYKFYRKNDFDILAFIPVQSNYPYVNDFLKNGIINQLNPTVDYLHLLSFLFYITAFVFLLFAYFFVNLRSIDKQKIFVWSSLIVLLIVIVSSFLKIPKVLYDYCFFSDQQYTANQVVSNLLGYSILGLIMLVVVSVTYINRLFVNQFFLLKRIVFYLFLLFYIGALHAIVLRNNISLNIASFEDFDVFVMWSWLILFVLTLIAISLLQILKRDYQADFKLSYYLLIDIGFIAITSLIYSFIHSVFLYNFVLLQVVLVGCFYLQILFLKNKKTLSLLTAFMVLITIYLLFTGFKLSAYQKHVKYKLQAENILINGNADHDPIAELLIEELDKSIQADENIRNMYAESIDLDSISNYIEKQYLHVFWNKYDVFLYAKDKYEDETQAYKSFLKSTGQKINQSNFYSLPSSLYTMSFIGWYDLNSTGNGVYDDLIYIFEFYPTKDFRSYSFPNLFASKETDVFKRTDISISQYENGKLTYHDKKTEWDIDEVLLNKQGDGFSKISVDGEEYYILSASGKQIVIKELSLFGSRSVLFFSVFLILIFAVLLRILVQGFFMMNLGSEGSLGFTAKFQVLFIFLLIISFVGTLLFSVGYIKNDYEREQIARIENKKTYIQKSLQEVLYWTEDLVNIDRQILVNNLQELAYHYQSDINIYDNYGVLQASTHPLVFSQSLLSDLVSPEVIFSEQVVHYQYENIGELSYLASYTELLNGDYLQLGYISIPQYFSQTELNHKIDKFIAVIIQIYLIIVLLAVITVLIIGKRIAAPMHLLMDKMKLMRIDGKNEKLEYASNDEIGQLVEQYNRTVDELEKSTRLLLTAERESAWQTMARQVAHEINNPLTPMRLTVQQLQRIKGIDEVEFDASFQKSTNLLIEQIDNLSRIASTFSQFAKLPETEFVVFDVAPKLLSVIELFRNNNENIEISCRIEQGEYWIIGDAEQLSQVFTNIMKNAVQSIPSNAKGKIDVLLDKKKDKICIKFKDNGIGISSDHQDSIFKPNFTTKSFGTGLGLSISKSIIENMDGKIYFESEVGVGSVFSIEFNLRVN